MLSTGCWRGYRCEYTVDDDQLFLTALEVSAADPPGELFGARVRLDGDAPAYSPIRVRQEFTGGLLLGTGFIEDLYVNMGHHPAWKYITVLEFTFDDGQLAAVHDRSELMAQRRAKGTHAATDPPHQTDPLASDPWTDDTAPRPQLPANAVTASGPAMLLIELRHRLFGCCSNTYAHF
jgi:hypothetical protein